MTGAAREHESLVATLERRFRVAESGIWIGGQEVSLLHPASAEELINEADFEQDERLPYWADVWPSAVILARRVADESGTGRRLLELGCGSGLVTVAAAWAGFETTATDYYPDALLFARANAWRNVGVAVRTRHVDWRDFPRDLGKFHRVVASDVLYERPYGALVAAAFAQTIAPHGRGLLTDPGRIAAGAFVDECGRLGLTVKKIARESFDTGVATQHIDVYEIRR